MSGLRHFAWEAYADKRRTHIPEIAGSNPALGTIAGWSSG